MWINGKHTEMIHVEITKKDLFGALRNLYGFAQSGCEYIKEDGLVYECDGVDENGELNEYCVGDETRAKIAQAIAFLEEQAK